MRSRTLNRGIRLAILRSSRTRCSEPGGQCYQDLRLLPTRVVIAQYHRVDGMASAISQIVDGTERAAEGCRFTVYFAYKKHILQYLTLATFRRKNTLFDSLNRDWPERGDSIRRILVECTMSLAPNEIR